MSWLTKISQTVKYLSTRFEIETQKIGTVYVSITIPFDQYHRWHQYRFSPDYQYDKDMASSLSTGIELYDNIKREYANKIVNMEPDCTLKIYHEMSDYMPSPQTTETEGEPAALTYMNQFVDKIQSDDYEDVMKLGNLKDALSSWLLMPLQEGHKDSRRIHRDEIDEVQYQLSLKIPNAMEDIQQKYWAETQHATRT